MRVTPVSPIAALGWPTWIATLTGFALLCGILAFWALTLLGPRPVSAPAPQPPEASAPGRARALFGDPTARTVSAPAALNITVLGIVAAGPRGSAILSVRGRPAQAFAPGDPIDESMTLISVDADRVLVGSRAHPIELPVPPRPDPAILNPTAQR